ncbi:hypothetical protein [Halopiger xanaduensis]|uniref:Uncharacterized protein n=1 Tax=Halopiger xanaduensis (strain DSM 18323 / JCM 14033 / SH-6) TaxID=797210 RepID=F8DEQ5_HALXS|nr:hypothetical protein [Halopiger xanaduensis]AEH39492.1 hypothetical protein Halxa_0252 [Halopiger xanaduensis SH-6]
MSSSDETRETFRYWSEAIDAAVQSERHTVELVPDGNGGIQVAIDGTAVFDGMAYPREQFNIAAGSYDYERYLTDDGLETVREVYATVNGGDE